MKIEIQYGNGAFSLPEAALERLTSAGEAEWRLLLLLCGPGENARSLREAFDPRTAAELLDLREEEIDAALAFWRGAGILKLPKGQSRQAAEQKILPAAGEAPLPSEKADGRSEKPAPEETGVPSGEEAAGDALAPLTVLRSDSEIHYTGEELDAITRQRPELKRLLEECQHVAGKLFSTAESCKIITLADYYRLPPEYILLLFQYSETLGKCSVPYVFRSARELFSREVRTLEELEAYFKSEEQKHTLTNTVRRLFGIGSRTLSQKEKRFLDAWTKAGYSEALVSFAYEQAVDATGEPSLPYMNKILERWQEAGIASLEAAQAAEADFRLKKEEAAGREKPRSRKAPARPDGSTPKGTSAPSFHSFDPDEFFRVALARSDEKSARLRAEKEEKEASTSQEEKGEAALKSQKTAEGGT